MTLPSTEERWESLGDRLDALLRQKPELAEAITFYRGALPVLRVAGAAVVPFHVDGEAARRKLEAGLPVLAGERLPFDPPSLLALFGMLCRAVEAAAPEGAPNGGADRGSSANTTGAHDMAQDDEVPAPRRGGLAGAAERIRLAAEEDELDLRSLVDAVARGDDMYVRQAADQLSLDAGLLTMLVQNTLKPTLRAWAEALAAWLNLGGWGQGACPICGSLPVLAEIHGPEGSLCLRCGLCGAAWPYPARQCAFCGNHVSERLRYFTLEKAAEKCYVQGCEECRGYLKAIVTTGHLPSDFVVTEDLATLELDVLASKQGYARAALRSFTQ